jgi:uncharacterized membrane protein
VHVPISATTARTLSPVPQAAPRYGREGKGLAFDRVAFFTDGVYAIALTLIVVGIGVPALSNQDDASDLWEALRDKLPEFASFFLGVLVIGFYWAANHAAFERVAAVDRGYVLLTVLYLAFVAFLPYPIRLVGAFDQNPLAMIVFSVNLAAVSTMETVLFAHAWRADLLAARPSRAGYRWMLLMSLLPVPGFLIAIPLVFVNPFLAPLAWVLLNAATSAVFGRRRPEGVPTV